MLWRVRAYALIRLIVRCSLMRLAPKFRVLVHVCTCKLVDTIRYRKNTTSYVLIHLQGGADLMYINKL